VILNKSGFPDGVYAYPNAPRSFGDVASSAISDDVAFSAASFAILMVSISRISVSAKTHPDKQLS
jgi:hypothetical protein